MKPHVKRSDGSEVRRKVRLVAPARFRESLPEPSGTKHAPGCVRASLLTGNPDDCNVWNCAPDCPSLTSDPFADEPIPADPFADEPEPPRSERKVYNPRRMRWEDENGIPVDRVRKNPPAEDLPSFKKGSFAGYRIDEVPSWYLRSFMRTLPDYGSGFYKAVEKELNERCD